MKYYYKVLNYVNILILLLLDNFLLFEKKCNYDFIFKNGIKIYNILYILND